MVLENRITIPQQLRMLEESLRVSNKVIRTQVANCQSTDDAWAILQGKFGNSDELLQNRMSLLENFKPPPQKFESLHCTWMQIWSDLATIGKTKWPTRMSFTRLRPESFINHANDIRSLRKNPPANIEALLKENQCTTIRSENS